jgi:hypothetical protein
MLKAICASTGLALLALACRPAAAEPLSTDLATDLADRTLRPGDKIEWAVPNPHFLRIGAVGLTPLGDVKKIITFETKLNESGGVANSASGGKVTGTVTDDAATQGVAEFTFTCGQHPTDMKSLPFPVGAKDGQAPRTLKIRAVSGNHWILERASGDVQVDTN